MKNLSTILLCDFIDILCGEENLVLEPGESRTQEEVRNYVRKMKVDYQKIVNPCAVNAVVADRHHNSLRHAKMELLVICINLINIGSKDEMADLLKFLGYDSPSFSSEDLVGKLKNELRRLEYEEKREMKVRENEPHQEKKNADEIRLSYDREMAAVMTIFRMSIDAHQISAAVYANLVIQAEKLVRAMKRQTVKF